MFLSFKFNSILFLLSFNFRPSGLSRNEFGDFNSPKLSSPSSQNQSQQFNMKTPPNIPNGSFNQQQQQLQQQQSTIPPQIPQHQIHHQSQIQSPLQQPSGRIQSPAVAIIAPKISREIAFRPNVEQPTSPPPMNGCGIPVNNGGIGGGVGTPTTNQINWSLINGVNGSNVSNVLIQQQQQNGGSGVRKADTDLTFLENDDPILQQKNKTNNMIPERERITSIDLVGSGHHGNQNGLLSSGGNGGVKVISSSNNKLPPLKNLQPVNKHTSNSIIDITSPSHHAINNSTTTRPNLTSVESKGNLHNLSQQQPQQQSHHQQQQSSPQLQQHQNQAETDNFSHHLNHNKNTINMRTHQHHATGTHELSRLRVSLN